MKLLNLSMQVWEDFWRVLGDEINSKPFSQLLMNIYEK